MNEAPPDEDDLVRAMIAVHGDSAAAVARENARTAAVAGQAARAKTWLKIVTAIQRQRAGIP
jgi:hypothetical protein